MLRSRLGLFLLVSRLFSIASVSVSALLLMVTLSFAGRQAQTAPTNGEAQKDLLSDKTAHVPAAEVAGSWQVSWQGRLGTEEGVLHLDPRGLETHQGGDFQKLRIVDGSGRAENGCAAVIVDGLLESIHGRFVAVWRRASRPM